ncbi:MAG: thiamine pyrophosphate-dependent enzyme, partial [Clostridiales bacterium]|nr:thiamine pyrophosphate-dependent enzyme [Clostridiales bacterium]
MPSKKKKTEKITEPLLPQIGSPKDLRRLSLEQLTRLAGEIRELILQTVSRCGGHLAPNLGVVELTLALHYVFNTPEDKLIWDVGHQCYAHKIVTGRREGFASLRAYGGLSGFPKSQESEYDCFNTGHSSTSISAALALAEARGLRGGDHDVIAVIGDGALTGGMAYEALNHAGDRKSKLIVVLNDNKMSIANNVGAMSKYLVRLRTDYRYGKAKHDFEAFLKSIPKVGPKVVRGIDRLKDSLKYFLMPGMIFEELGFIYLGPINGHNLASLEEVFFRAKK